MTLQASLTCLPSLKRNLYGINSLKLVLLFQRKTANYLTKPAETDSSAILLNAVRYFSSHSSKGTTNMCKSANYETKYEMHVLDQFHNR